MDVRTLLPKNKYDDHAVDQLLNLTEEEIEPIMADLLTWFQDINWPVANKLIPIIGKHRKTSGPYILEILKGTDEVWKYNMIAYAIHAWPADPDDALTNEIARIAWHPTQAEAEAEVDQVAKDFLESHA